MHYKTVCSFSIPEQSNILPGYILYNVYKYNLTKWPSHKIIKHVLINDAFGKFNKYL